MKEKLKSQFLNTFLKAVKPNTHPELSSLRYKTLACTGGSARNNIKQTKYNAVQDFSKLSWKNTRKFPPYVPHFVSSQVQSSNHTIRPRAITT